VQLRWLSTQARASDWRGRHSALRATGRTSVKPGIHISPPSKCPAERPGKPDSVSPTIPLGKFPDGRQSIQNASFTAPHRLDCESQRNDFWGQWLLPGGKLKKTAWIVAQDGVFWPTLNSGARPALHRTWIWEQFRFCNREDNPLPSTTDSRLRDGLAGSREGSSREVSSLPVLPSRVFSG
jgi:hypothetical protein